MKLFLAKLKLAIEILFASDDEPYVDIIVLRRDPKTGRFVK